MAVKNIFISGVGGQGTILAGKVITTVLVNLGYDVKMSEVHGMAQRGGSVVTQIRYGEKVYSPLIEKGKADVLLAFEKLEAVRYVEYLAPEGTLIVNDLEMPPASVLIGKEEYPADIVERLKEKIENMILVDAVGIAKECGEMRAQNMVLVGVLAKVMGWPKDALISVIREVVPEKYVDVNITAFERGWDMGVI
ncbi:indolepyruvate ferredoxin oxidoreductase beta subunit [Caldanaerovirga acetigignens]|jgi:indolepyruvate ferredoxin oxidoreductase beta subunit|uniref:Indolepyruvate ferredoxin oxidoreductase beta subunit n=1 Tax=Caldanaerovirga acetigignens TaxID=447595 RepID=A0A1M7I6N6_9FIRM|nr:indolepyruvate oxidoreductase subunit beta [Caldanaerovirga acetigignens]SHM36289.1 indolepyruvate ferredoxin oxidoreductase beta subunit [Caldanaerovirga acetigignens]